MRTGKGIILGTMAITVSVIASLCLPSQAARSVLCIVGAAVGISLVGWAFVTLTWGGKQ